jgi:hypothetical protein
MRSAQSDMESGEDVESSRHRGKSDRCITPTIARPRRPPWLGEEALQERPQAPAKLSTSLSQKGDIKSAGNGHGGGNDYFSTPTRADIPRTASNIARTVPPNRNIDYAVVPEELYTLGRKDWWELSAQKCE